MKILIINGPNINILSYRSSSVYPQMTLEKLYSTVEDKVKDLAVECHWFQSNHEGDVIDKIQENCILAKRYDGLIINPAGHTHSSVALFDTLCCVEIPIIEVHLSQIFKHQDQCVRPLITTKAANGCVFGLGTDGYVLAIMALKMKYHTLEEKNVSNN